MEFTKFELSPLLKAFEYFASLMAPTLLFKQLLCKENSENTKKRDYEGRKNQDGVLKR
tara:strand:- start:301 stop:474 length:174 start_codon:yes stop_codon:yes gene_type:complete